MNGEFLRATLGRSGPPVARLGLSASYRPGERTVERALDEGLNYFFCYGFDRQMTRVLRALPARVRETVVISTGAYNYGFARQNLDKVLERRLRQLRTDYIDVFMFLGVLKPSHLTPGVREQLERLRHDPRVRAVAISCHDRVLAGRLAEEGALDALMIRYNAAHRGAENDIFPHLERHRPGIVCYTATRWTALIRRTRGWPRDRAIPTPGQCYRFVLTNPNVDVCLTAPRSEGELLDNLAAVSEGPLPDDEMTFMREYGDLVHRNAGWFM